MSPAAEDSQHIQGNRLRVATLAVGTEITDGQILDRNSQWLSERMLEFSCEIVEHRAVPDDREKILRGLRELSDRSDVLFVTGGLGPTSDDFTRDCVGEFLSNFKAPGHTREPLVWNAEAWAWVEERLKSRGSPITENQKQQCFFPAGTALLKNSHGTACGFFTQTTENLLVCLPGPSTEVESIWHTGLSQVVRTLIEKRNVTPRRLSLLRTMGIGEGALAFAVEEILTFVSAKYKLPRLEVGYRAHAPYVEVKVWSQPNQQAMADAALQLIRTKFAEFYINSDQEDVADCFLAQVIRKETQGRKIAIVDTLTQGEFYRRVLDRVRATSKTSGDGSLLSAFLQDVVYLVASRPDWFQSLVESTKAKADTFEVYSLEPGESDRQVVLRHGQEMRVIEMPKLAVGIATDRGRKWVTETALRIWGSEK